MARFHNPDIRPPGEFFGHRPALITHGPERTGPIRQNGTVLGPDATLFTGEADLPLSVSPLDLDGRKGTSLVVERQASSYLSLAIEMPHEVAAQVTPSSLLRILAETEFPAPLFLRLNLRQGPNCESLTWVLASGGDCVDFDLKPLDFFDRAMDAIWIDIIAERPAPSALILSDLQVFGYPRAIL